MEEQSRAFPLGLDVLRDQVEGPSASLVRHSERGLALSAIAQVLFGLPGTALLWLAIASAMARDEARSRRQLQTASGALLALLVVGHGVEFRLDALRGAAAGINGAMLLTAMILLWLGRQDVDS